MEQYAAIGRNGVLIHATTGLDLKNIMLKHYKDWWCLHNIMNVIRATELYFKIVKMENFM